MSSVSPEPGAWERQFAAPSVALRKAMRAAEEVDLAFARRLGLGSTDVAALDRLLEDGPMGPAELGEALGMRSASATALVDRLERVGHVQRRPHASDRRRVDVVATPHAAQEAWTALGPLFERIERVAAELSLEEQHVVAGYLDRIADEMRAYVREGRG